LGKESQKYYEIKYKFLLIKSSLPWGLETFPESRALNIEFRKVLEFIWSIVTRLKFSKAFSLVQNVQKFHYFTKRTLDNLEKDKIKYICMDKYTLEIKKSGKI
jgi:hypothetical protein